MESLKVWIPMESLKIYEVPTSATYHIVENFGEWAKQQIGKKNFGK